MLKSAARFLMDKLGYELRKKPIHRDERSWFSPSVPAKLEKATATKDRFREIISDPLNLLIERDPLSGIVSGGFVKLHTGIVVPMGGVGSYYGEFSDILMFNRGVHEPLEEFAFQELVYSIHQYPTMLELGAYWGHYSMWMKKFRPHATVFLVEPNPVNLQSGEDNFRRNQLTGTFINDVVGKGHFEVDRFLEERAIDKLDVLHADIQGAETFMLEGCKRSFHKEKVSYCFISTHSQKLHSEVAAILKAADFRLEASADFDHETTSFDGLIFAAHASAPVILDDFRFSLPWKRSNFLCLSAKNCYCR